VGGNPQPFITGSTVRITLCIYIAVDPNFFHLQTATLRAKSIYVRESFASPRFSFAGLSLSTFVLLRRMQTACKTATVWVIRETAKGRCKAMLGEFHQETTEFHCFLAPLTCKGAMWAMGFHGHLLFCHCFRKTFAKLSQKTFANQPKKTHTEAGLRMQLHLIANSTWDYSIPTFAVRFRRFSLHTSKNK